MVAAAGSAPENDPEFYEVTTEEITPLADDADMAGSNELAHSMKMIQNLRHMEDVASTDVERQAHKAQLRLRNRAMHGGNTADDSSQAKVIFAKVTPIKLVKPYRLKRQT